MRENFHTLFRALVCILALWLLEIGSYTVPFDRGAALLVATVVGVLVAYELAVRDVPPLRMGMTAGTIFALILAGFSIYRAFQPPPPNGPLRPAGEPTPAIACREKPGQGDLVMTFGTNSVIGHGDGPFTPFKVTDCPVLSLKRTAKGLVVNDIGYDDNNDVAFLIRNGVYQPMQILELRVIRPDPSTFILLDRFREEVVYVRYLNRNAVRIRGRFICGDAQAVIGDRGILLGGKRINGVWYGKRSLGPARGCLVVPSPVPRR
jgi:hypothetical protein